MSEDAHADGYRGPIVYREATPEADAAQTAAMQERARMFAAEAALAEALSLLREGARCHKYDQCPICDAGLGDPCVPGCRLAAFLAAHPEPSTVEGTDKLPANSEDPAKRETGACPVCAGPSIDTTGRCWHDKEGSWSCVNPEPAAEALRAIAANSEPKP
jgi:hypothetical protein